jgi:hypothetical protein
MRGYFLFVMMVSDWLLEKLATIFSFLHRFARTACTTTVFWRFFAEVPTPVGTSGQHHHFWLFCTIKQV